MTPNLTGLPETITAPRTDPIYNCHGYLTKVPVAAIEPFIECFTEPGDTIADFFAGSGMTGLAAVRVGRKARLSDISVLGRHIATGYLTAISPASFEDAAAEVIAKARATIGSLYHARRAEDGTIVEMVRTIWSFTYACPSCRQELVYFKHISSNGKPPKACPSCGELFVRRTWAKSADVPVVVVVRDKKDRLAAQPVSHFDPHAKTDG